MMCKEHKVLVRCALQTIPDRTVLCPGDWTVLKLKEYLRDVCDHKPDPARQRLIYGGKCLSDAGILENVLTQDQETQVVHLVYTPTVEQLKQTKLAAAATTNAQQSEVRRRNVEASSTQPPTTSVDSTFVPLQNVQNMYQYTNNPMMADPQQQFMMAQQQMYNAYMANYFNYMQQMIGMSQMSGGGLGLAPQIIPQPNLQPAAPLVENNNNVNNANAVPQNNANNNQQQPELVMNAQGGLVDADVGPGGNGDWLDWLYGCSRVGIMLMILYFYSSFERFIMVALCVSVLYAIHKGWFRLRANDVPPVVAPVNNPQPNLQNDNDNNAQQAESEAAVEEASAWTIFWSTCYTFITAFFTSLVPERPPPVNIN